MLAVIPLTAEPSFLKIYINKDKTEVLTISMDTLWQIQNSLRSFVNVGNIVITNQMSGRYLVDFTHHVGQFGAESTLTIKENEEVK